MADNCRMVAAPPSHARPANGESIGKSHMNVKLMLKVVGCVGALIALQALSPSTYAADTPAAVPGQSDDLVSIIVTARRVEERLQDVPISINVFNQQQLDNRNIVNANDLAAYIPSLQVNSNFGAANSAFAIRGFVQDIGT
jgi:iron complex outermembrane recepter protein